MSETTSLVDLQIVPNEKYHRVIGLYGHPDGLDDEPLSEEYDDWPDEHQDAADDYVEVVDNAPAPEDHGVDPDEVDPLSWDHISPSSDPDLLAKIATYFEGMAPDEPSDLLRAKCRLLDVDIYAEAQVAARQELRE